MSRVTKGKDTSFDIKSDSIIQLTLCMGYMYRLDTFLNDLKTQTHKG